MDLKKYLLKVYENREENKISEMLEELGTLGIKSTSDLKYIDEDTFKDVKCFTRIEVKKLIDYVKNPDPERLENVLMEIFVGISAQKLTEIERKLNEHEIYARKDILVIDSTKLREFSEADIRKIEGYLEKYNKDHYIKIMEEKTFKESDLREEVTEVMEERHLEELNPEILKDVLKVIFSDILWERLNKIEHFLNDKEIYSGKDIEVLNTVKLKKEDFFTEAEITKLDDFIKKKNRRKYEENIEEKMRDDKKRNTQLASNLKIFDQRVNLLMKEKHMLLQELSGFLKGSNKNTKENWFTRKLSKGKSDNNRTNNAQETNSEKLSEKEKNIRKRLKKVYEQQYEIGADLPSNEDKEILENILNNIFVDTNKDRLRKIKITFNEKELYLVDDIQNNKWMDKGSLSNEEIAKIYEYITGTGKNPFNKHNSSEVDHNQDSKPERYENGDLCQGTQGQMQGNGEEINSITKQIDKPSSETNVVSLGETESRNAGSKEEIVKDNTSEVGHIQVQNKERHENSLKAYEHGDLREGTQGQMQVNGGEINSIAEQIYKPSSETNVVSLGETESRNAGSKKENTSEVGHIQVQKN